MKTVTTALAAAALLSLAACGKKADNVTAANDIALNETDTIPADDNFSGVDNTLPADNALDNAADATTNAADATANAAETNAL